MMCKRPDTVCKLECINKFSVVVSYQFGKYFFIENFYYFPEDSIFWNSSHFIGSFVFPHADRLGKLYALLTKAWVESMDS